MPNARPMRALSGTYASSSTPYRADLDALDTANDVDSPTFVAVAHQNCYGVGGILVQALFTDPADIASVVPVFYDKDDALLYVGPEIDLVATDLEQHTGDKHLSNAEFCPVYGATRVRLYVTAISLADDMDLLIGTTDGFSR